METTGSISGGHGSRRLVLLLGAAVAMVGAVALATLGGPHDASLAFLMVAERVIYAGGLAAAYVVAGVGLGRLFRPLFPGSTEPLALQTVVGLGVLFWLSHLLAWLGAFGGAAGPFVAAGVLIFGVGVGLWQFLAWIRAGGFEPRMNMLGVIGAAGVAVLIAAASNPPGWLWDSEFGAYDALSYHLQLPQEWLAAGRLAPVAHNVYSYLPGYMEAAFMHLGAATFAPGPDGADAWGLMAGEGYRAFGAQFLAVFVTVLTAVVTSRAARAAMASAADGLAVTLGASLAGCLVLVTPWAIVTGSLAYNDMGVLLFFAGALLAVWDRGLEGWRKGLVIGLMVGAACSVKPTALLFVAAPAAIAVAAGVPARQWVRLGLAGAAGGLVMVLPWLIRNWAASGNPVFPFAAGLFPNAGGGTGHWTAEQVSRYASGHHFGGSVLDRLRLMVMPEAAAAGVPEVSRWRGMSHPQWGLFFPLVAGAALLGLVRAASHRTAAVLTAMLAVQTVLWLSFTHIQSRFLLPMLVPGAVLCGLAAAACVRRGACRGVPEGACRAAAVVLAGVQATAAVMNFADERRASGDSGHPNRLLTGGISARTAAGVREELGIAPREAAEAWVLNAAPEAFINAVVPEDAAVYLLGDATPLYFGRPVVYNTTWDRWPFAEAARANPDDPALWSGALKSRGIDLVLVNLPEIRRLARSGFIDPAVTEERVDRWMRGGTRLVRAWPEAGVFLVELPDGGPP